jgi:hypothetical protein
MKWMRVLWAAGTLLLAVSGCSDDQPPLSGGIYAPVITGVKTDPEPAVRDEQVQVTVLVTNVNNYPLTYHWSTAWGTLTDSTDQTAKWITPDSIGSYPVTCAIVAQGEGVTFYKSTTFQIFVDNEYVRWTRSDAVQFDPAPIVNGGVIFAQYKGGTAVTSDIYSVLAPEAGSTKLTQGIHTAVSPSMQADGQKFAFAGRPTALDSIGIWLLPGTGGGVADLTPVARWNSSQRILGSPRFVNTGTFLLYSSDTSAIGNPRPWYRDAFNPAAAPTRVIAQNALGTNAFFGANWGPDLNGDGIPDSVVTESQRNFGQRTQFSRGFFKLPTSPPQTVANQWLADSSAAEPDWSPDGQYVIYARPNPPFPERDIWIIRADATSSSQAIRVTFGPADDSHPRFSADGSTIYFVSNRADYYGINGIFPIERRGTNVWSVSLFDVP